MLAHKISQNVANIPENYLVNVSDIHLDNTRYARRVGGGGGFEGFERTPFGGQ